MPSADEDGAARVYTTAGATWEGALLQRQHGNLLRSEGSGTRDRGLVFSNNTWKPGQICLEQPCQGGQTLETIWVSSLGQVVPSTQGEDASAHDSSETTLILADEQSHWGWQLRTGDEGGPRGHLHWAVLGWWSSERL